MDGFDGFDGERAQVWAPSPLAPETPNDGRAEPPCGPAFEIISPPAPTCPLVFASSHSGRIYPPALMAASRLDARSIRRSEDVLVDQLFAAAPRHGAPLILARYARAYVDLNREAYELDPRLFHDALPAWVRTQTPRAAAGLGSVARVVGEGQEIYHRRLTFAEAQARIESIHRPYHAALDGLLTAAEERFGFAILIDAHSMPSAALGSPSGPLTAEVVLGDRHGSACAGLVIDRAEALLRTAGLRTARNAPYAGGWTTEHHGRPAAGRHALQIEVVRSLYVDERTLKPSAGFGRLEQRLAEVIAGLCDADWSALAR